MNRFRWVTLLLALPLLAGCFSVMQYLSYQSAQSVSPYDYGLAEAKTGVERYNVLYQAHKAAIETGKRVSYQGITSLDIEVPLNAASIPLSEENDFAGVEFNVKNTTKDIFLFKLVNSATEISVSKSDIDGGRFVAYSQLRKGVHLLSVSDDSLWIFNRKGYAYGHIRKDILVVRNGRSENAPVMPYNNTQSSPSCVLYEVPTAFSFSNITLNRSSDSSKKTYLLDLKGYNNVTLSNVAIHTPDNDWTGDVAIRINDCANVHFEDVTIDGTYSRTNYSGYGVNMNNIWNLSVLRMYGKGNWGVFGTNNINNASFRDSDINRFDIHCYGRDISFSNVNFTDKYNQLNSVFGKISFDGCTFTDFYPVLNDVSYNAYVGYDIEMKNCVFNATRRKPILVDCGSLNNRVNSRPEVRARCLPNIKISNLTVNVDDDVTAVYLFFFRLEGSFERRIDYLTSIDIDGVTFKYKSINRSPVDFYLSNVSLPLASSLSSDIRNVDVIGATTDVKKKGGNMVVNLKYRSSPVTLKTGSLKVTSLK